MELASDQPKNLYTKVLTPELGNKCSRRRIRPYTSESRTRNGLDSLAKQQQEQAGEGIVKQGILLQKQGKLDAGWVTAHSALLKPEQMTFLFDQAAGKNAVTDSHVYAGLLDRASKGDNVADDAKTALYQRTLSTADYTRLVGAWRKATFLVQPRDSVTRTSGQVSQMEPDPAKSQTLANMTNDWQDWAQQNPNAKPQEAEHEYMDIVRRYQFIPQAQAQLMLPVPRYISGSRAAPDLQRTKADTVAAFRAGEISRAEFNKQAALIQQWSAATSYAKQRASAANQ